MKTKTKEMKRVFWRITNAQKRKIESEAKTRQVTESQVIRDLISATL